MARFADVSDNELNKLLEDRHSINTKHSTTLAWRVFEAYTQAKNINLDLLSIEKSELCEILRKFYVEIRKSDGTMYTKSSFRTIRGGLQRKIYESRKDIDIINSPEFVIANEVFAAQCVYLKQIGLAKVQHKLPISQEDVWKLYDSPALSIDSPSTLQQKVFFDMLLFLCRRGNENLRNLKKTDFQLRQDEKENILSK